MLTLEPPIKSGGDNHGEGAQSAHASEQPAKAAIAAIAHEDQQPQCVYCETRQHKQEPGWFGVPFDGWVAGGTVALFLATAGLFIFTAKLWQATKTLISDERESSARELRAYVHSIGFPWFWHHDPATGAVWYSFKVHMKNFGNTPARDVRLYVGQYGGAVALPETFPFSTTDDGGTPISLGPGGDVMTREVYADGSWLSDVGANIQFFYLWGWAKYRDAFEGTPERETQFCVRVTVRGNPAQAPSETNAVVFTFNFERSHNRAT